MSGYITENDTLRLTIKNSFVQHVDGYLVDSNPEILNYAKKQMLEEFKSYVNSMTVADIQVAPQRGMKYE